MVGTIIKTPNQLKSKTAIKNPHHLHVKVTTERKIELKMLATRRRETLLVMFSTALQEFLANPPTTLARIPAPEHTDRFVFKVEPSLAARVHDIVKKLGVPAQTVITAAIDTFITTHYPWK